MPSITSFLRSLGNHRAVANAQDSMDERAREDWLVAGLLHRVEIRDRAVAGAAAAAGGEDASLGVRAA